MSTVATFYSPCIYSSLFGSPRVLSIWPGLSSSPILTDYTWSPLVQSAVSRNFAILQPSSTKTLCVISSKTTLSGLVAVHLQRGDYKRHCPRLAEWHSLYMGFNQFPTLPDKLDPSPYSQQPHRGVLSGTLLAVRRADCGTIACTALREPRTAACICTDRWLGLVNSLEIALRQDGWDEMKGSLDLHLDSQQTWVSMTVDIAITEKAEAFVGNGASLFISSSLSRLV
jgi:hypothetical protein